MVWRLSHVVRQTGDKGSCGDYATMLGSRDSADLGTFRNLGGLCSSALCRCESGRAQCDYRGRVNLPSSCQLAAMNPTVTAAAFAQNLANAFIYGSMGENDSRILRVAFPSATFARYICAHTRTRARRAHSLRHLQHRGGLFICTSVHADGSGWVVGRISSCMHAHVGESKPRVGMTAWYLDK